MKVYIDDKYADPDDPVIAIVVDSEAFDVISENLDTNFQIGVQDVREGETPEKSLVDLSQVCAALQTYRPMEGR